MTVCVYVRARVCVLGMVPVPAQLIRPSSPSRTRTHMLSLSLTHTHTPQVAPGVEIRALYAGHVLGGAMFHVRVGAHTVLYTGGWGSRPAYD